MIYKIIRMEYQYKKDRFYRTIMVRKDINLIELGCVMCTAIGTEFEHNFLFIKDEKEYSPDVFVAEGIYASTREVPMKNYSLSDLGNKFTFWYDTGEDWLFDCEVYKKETEVVGAAFAYLVDGKGQGVWEDNAGTLRMYLDGDLDPNLSEEDPDKGIYFPWNCDIEKLSDFDTKFNIAEQKEYFDSAINTNIDSYLEGMHESGFELEVKSRTDEVFENMDIDNDPDTAVNMRLNSLIMKVVDEQINTLDYVNKKYKELLKKYDDLTVRNKIGEVLANEIFDVMTNNKQSSDSEYKKKIEKIK